MKELLRGESTRSLKAVVLKWPNAELYLVFKSKHVKQSHYRRGQALRVPEG
jgi:hypothetical protein